jgi:hypothetical protein
VRTEGSISVDKKTQTHFADEHEEPHLQEAISIQQEYFSETSDLGIIRIQENQTYQRHEDEFDSYLPEVIDDLNTLFSTG